MNIAPYSITIVYIIVGGFLLIFVPSCIFRVMEGKYIKATSGCRTFHFRLIIICYLGWSFLDCIYFSLISLSTIGFGDFVPRNAPPIAFGEH